MSQRPPRATRWSRPQNWLRGSVMIGSSGRDRTWRGSRPFRPSSRCTRIESTCRSTPGRSETRSLSHPESSREKSSGPSTPWARTRIATPRKSRASPRRAPSIATSRRGKSRLSSTTASSSLLRGGARAGTVEGGATGAAKTTPQVHFPTSYHAEGPRGLGSSPNPGANSFEKKLRFYHSAFL